MEHIITRNAYLDPLQKCLKSQNVCFLCLQDLWKCMFYRLRCKIPFWALPASWKQCGLQAPTPLPNSLPYPLSSPCCPFFRGFANFVACLQHFSSLWASKELSPSWGDCLTSSGQMHGCSVPEILSPKSHLIPDTALYPSEVLLPGIKCTVWLYLAGLVISGLGRMRGHSQRFFLFLGPG